jgi:hypothetical protein
MIENETTIQKIKPIEGFTNSMFNVLNIKSVKTKSDKKTFAATLQTFFIFLLDNQNY